LITGFCGGFTTFSSFADALWVLGNKGDWTTSLVYLLASVILGVLLVWAGRALIR
ncbi:MAG: CrcB family protein, partial [Muribaculaceae bacterium]|nr:CrcB family protein [Muribaculaceae bacterium]